MDRPELRVIVVGTSAGGVDALQRLTEELPADLPAAVVAVLHMAQGRVSELPSILARRSALPVRFAEDGQPLAAGQVSVAPPDRHLFVEGERLRLRDGPRVNLARPSIDVAFRSAALSLGPRAVGVVLTGYLDDGSDGLRAIRRCGGIAVVQDPEDAQFPDMPVNAMRLVTPDHRVPLAGMGALLGALAREPLRAADTQAPAELALEVGMDRSACDDIAVLDGWGSKAGLGCPQCGGPLWERRDGTQRRYRCHIGHALTSLSLQSDQNREVETALWTAVRTLEERARVVQAVSGDPPSAQATALARHARAHAQQLRELITRYRLELPELGAAAPANSAD